jgi:5-methylcytosine-specific restriction endonuclease McrA
MEAEQAALFDSLAKKDTYGVWALRLTDEGRNLRVWDAIEPGDVAAFYTAKRFTHYAPIAFKWRSDAIQGIAGWKPPEAGSYSLALAVDKLQPCDLSDDEYCALVGYRRVPVHSDFHNEADSQELLAALEIRLPSPRSGENDDLDPEGALRYRIQQFRERSDGNRLRVLDLKGHVCEVCGYDFANQFGDGFQPSAHVHHKKPLALGERKAESVDEFAVLCAPCHTAAHMGSGRKLNPWTIEELRDKIHKRWDG